MSSVAVICVDCGAGNPVSDTYCGGCGSLLFGGDDGAAPHPGFTGPRRLIAFSGAAFLASLLFAAADIFLMQLLDVGGLGFGGPIVGLLLEAAGASTSGSSDGIGLLMVGTLLLAALVASASATCGAAGGIWLLLRWREGDGPSRVGAAVATAGEAGRKQLHEAQTRGAEGLEKAKPVLAETAERSRAAAGQAKDSAVERYEEMAPVVRRVAREGRATFDQEVAPRVSTGVRKGAAWGRERFEALRKRREESGR